MVTKLEQDEAETETETQRMKDINTHLKIEILCFIN
jgi:hypothetical protein